MSIKDQIFKVKEAYFFEDTGEKLSSDFLLKELIFQLSDLEKNWLSFPTTDVSSVLSLNDRIELEKIRFRLQEILRFIKQNKGPKIIEFVCSEINDLIYEKIVMQAPPTSDELNQVSIILTVMSTYFQPEMFIRVCFLFLT